MELERIYRNELTAPQKREVVNFIQEMRQVGYTQAVNLCNGRGKLLPGEVKKIDQFIKKFELC